MQGLSLNHGTKSLNSKVSSDLSEPFRPNTLIGFGDPTTNPSYQIACADHSNLSGGALA